MTGKLSPRSAAQWGAVLPQYLGMVGLLVMLVFWMATAIITGEGRTEPALLTAFGGLIAIGQGAEVIAALRQPPPLDPEPDPEPGEATSTP